MTSSNDDGHGPETCNYQACKAIDPKVPCPFVRDEQLEVVNPFAEDYELAAHQDAEHEHQYTIAVEWFYAGKTETPINSRAAIAYVPASKRVTKLRCVCGAEIKR